MQIDALEKVLEKLPNASLKIVGSGSRETDLKKRIAEKSYADRIMLTGDVEHKITLHLINEADILLRTTKFDGDAIAVREALFLETPVIATENGMRPDGVHKIPISDSESLVKKIHEVAKFDKNVKSEKSDDNSNIIEILKIYENIVQ